MPFQIVKPVIDLSVRNLCYRKYYNHSKGCPNYGQKAACPPRCKTIDKIIDLNNVVYAIWNIFDFKKHCDRMRSLHPEWSDRQVECCLYWQGGARKQLKLELIKFLRTSGRGLTIVKIPEATGVNVTATMNRIGIELEWPPKNITYQIALAGKRIME